MKLFVGIATMALSACFAGSIAVARQKPQIPDSLRQASHDPDVIKRRAAYAQLHVMRPYAVLFQELPFNPIPSKGTSADLRKQISDYGIGVKDQGSRGTCSVFALDFLHEYTMCRKTGRKHPNFSEEYLNFIGNVAAGAFVDGGFFSDLNNGYQTYGHIPQRVLPYSDPMNPDVNTKGYTLEATGEKAIRYPAKFIKPWDNTKGPTTAEMHSACDELDAGVPVASGFLWPDKGHFKQKLISGVDMMVKI